MKQQKSGRSVRLVGGPFSGKRLDTPQFGRNTITIRDYKPMSRKQQFEWRRNNASYAYYNPADPNHGMRYPIVEAEYRICTKPMAAGNGYMTMINLEHPDGSLFYEFTGNKREF